MHAATSYASPSVGFSEDLSLGRASHRLLSSMIRVLERLAAWHFKGDTLMDYKPCDGQSLRMHALLWQGLSN